MEQKPKSNLKISNILDHNIYGNTDKLYDPLRTVLINPETAIKHQNESPNAAKSTILEDPYKRLTYQDAEKIRREIYIPIDQQLLPTNNFDKVISSRMRVIDAQERVIGGPIKQEDMKIIRKNQENKQSKIVYELSQNKTTQLNSNQELKKLSRGGPNLKSQIFNSEEISYQTNRNLTHAKSVENLKLSSIQDHHNNPDMDRLYEPLRVVLTHPQIPMKNEVNSPKAASLSLLGDHYKRITYQDALLLKKDILIPTKEGLFVSNNLEVIKNKKFRVVNASERVLQKSISQKQLDNIIKNVKREQIIYQFTKDNLEQQKQKSFTSPNLEFAQKINPQEQFKSSKVKNVPGVYSYNLQNVKESPSNFGCFDCNCQNQNDQNIQL